MTMIGKHLPYMQDIPDDIQASINRASGISGESVAHLTRVMNLESGGDPRARNKSGAKGLFQIMPKTWREIQRDNPTRNLKDVFNAEQNAIGAALLNKQYRNTLSKNLNRPVTDAEVSGAHYFGPGGYEKLVRNPNTATKDLFNSAVYSQNRSALENRTGRQTVDFLNTRYKKASTSLPISKEPKYNLGRNDSYNITLNDKRYSTPSSDRYSVASVPRSYSAPKSKSYSSPVAVRSAPQPERIEASPSSYRPGNSDVARKYWKGGTSFSDR